MPMDVKEVRFWVLDVGQGACNYVEIVDQSDVVIHNMLIDLGTNSSQAIATANIEWLKARISIRPDPRIDVLALTHGDNDHYNLMLRLLPALNPAQDTRIGMVRYGGVPWRYKIGATSLIDLLELYCTDVLGMTPVESSFDDENFEWNPIWPEDPEEGDVKLQLIIANTPHPRDSTIQPKPKQRANAEAINSKSIVLGVEWDGHWCVGTGDATSTTIAAINELLVTEQPDELPKCFMMTLPHHGSRKTTYDLTSAADLPTEEAVEVVAEFLEKFSPKTVSISADEKRHHHPSILMIEQFAGYTNQDVKYWSDPSLDNNRHFLTAWMDKTITAPGILPAWPAAFQYATTQTGDNVFSTLYFDNPKYNAGGYPRYICPPIPAVPSGAGTLLGPPRGRNWEFRMDEDALHVDSTANAHPAANRRAVFTAFRSAVPPRLSGAPPRRVQPPATRGTPPTFTCPPVMSVATHSLPGEPTGSRLRSLKAIT